MAENYLKLVADNKPQIHKVQRTSIRINNKNTVHRHIIFKLFKTKEKIMKTPRKVEEGDHPQSKKARNTRTLLKLRNF